MADYQLTISTIDKQVSSNRLHCFNEWWYINGNVQVTFK